MHCGLVIHALVHGYLGDFQSRASVSVVAELLINIIEYSFIFFSIRIFGSLGKKYLV